jgi:hypothetical protein
MTGSPADVNLLFAFLPICLKNLISPFFAPVTKEPVPVTLIVVNRGFPLYSFRLPTPYFILGSIS